MTTPQDPRALDAVIDLLPGYLPAFPTEADADYKGMNLRDYFAGQFIQGGDPVDFDIRMRHDVAKYAYMMADAMLAARNAKR
jgi:hypothetical protein